MYRPFGWLVTMLCFVIVLSGCAVSDTAGEEKKIEQNGTGSDQQSDIEIELSDYAKEVGATLSQPESQMLTVNQTFTISGEIKDVEQLKQSYMWIQLRGPNSEQFDYYTPIENGTFKQHITLFSGKGEYAVTIRLPDQEIADRFYDMAELQVINESSEIVRDIAMKPPGLDAGLRITSPTDGLTKADATVPLEGTVDEAYGGKNLMIKERKDGQSSDILIPISSDGTFKETIPLHYGQGQHEMTIMVPDLSQDNYYLESAVLIINNDATTVTEPITFYKTYYEQKFQLDTPIASGLKAGNTFRVSGTYDPDLVENQEIEQLIVTTKKEDKEASYLIPAENGTFDGEFWLRFGAGEYEVTLNVPTDPGAQKSYFEFAGLATFTVNSDAENQQDLLPSRGIQANAQSIETLASELTNGKKNNRDKAKAIYKHVTKTIKYDVEKYENDAFKLDDSALRTLKLQKGVCQDYAFLTVALLRAAGIESHYIAGTGWPEGALSSERHAWVEAKVGGEWIVMDPTWGAGYVQDGKFVPHYDDQYFDPDMSEFQKTHTREEVIY